MYCITGRKEVVVPGCKWSNRVDLGGFGFSVALHPDPSTAELTVHQSRSSRDSSKGNNYNLLLFLKPRLPAFLSFFFFFRTRSEVI